MTPDSALPLSLTRRRFLKRLAAGSAAGLSAAAAAGSTLGVRGAEPSTAARAFDPAQSLLPSPSDPVQRPAFRERLKSWRAAARADLAYSDALYRRSDFAWVPSNFACGFLMLNDEQFYDWRRAIYTVRQFLEQARAEFGGFDSVVLWHAYPRIGLDSRNQFDCYRDQPGGLEGLRAAINELHRDGVRVFLDYNPWDQHTRREETDDLDALATLVQALDADGLFLDTLDRGADALRARLDAARPGVALEGELALPLDRVHDHHLSWAQWFEDSPAPGVLRNKWFERRHQQHQIKRWDRDHTGELHSAWMNGSGMLIWENVFGTWNGWCDRDKSILRSMLPIQRRFATLFTGEGWTPLVPTLSPHVFASLWEGGDLRLWTLVNRSDQDVKGPLFEATFGPREKIWDAIIGEPAQLGRAFRGVPDRNAPPMPVLGFLPPRGLACFVAAQPDALGPDFQEFLARQRDVLKRARWSTRFPERHAVAIGEAAAPGAVPMPVRGDAMPPGMVRVAVPGGKIRLKTVFRVRECGFHDSTHPHFNTRFPALHKPFEFEREITLKPFAIDRTLVTNAQFAAFLKATGYTPKQTAAFLMHWLAGAPPSGREEHPVVYVDLDDARTFARWAGKRLPSEEEWQFAAQGPDGRLYPWGNARLPGRCNGGQTGATTPVHAFPDGASPFGCLDMTGNVWQWTESERSDGRTRFAILRGGSFYKRGGSAWYFDEGPQPVNFAAKLLLHWPGLDRCENVGFRCCVGIEG